MSDAPNEHQRLQDARPVAVEAGLLPSTTDYNTFGSAAADARTQNSAAMVRSGLLTDLHIDHRAQPLAQSQSKMLQGYAIAPDLDAIDPSQLSPDAQFGGAAGNWFRYVGRSIWHGLDASADRNGTDQTIFGSFVSVKHYCSENSMQAVFNDINKLGDHAKNVLWNIPGDLQNMTPEQQSRQSAELTGCAAFFFYGARSPILPKVAELMELEKRTELELCLLGIQKRADVFEEDGIRLNSWAKELSGESAENPARRSLNDIEARDWYNAKVARIDDVEQQMRHEGKSAQEIFEATTKLRNEAKLQAREAMADQAMAASLPPIPTPAEILHKYDGDYERAIAATKRTNSKVNETIELKREQHND